MPRHPLPNWTSSAFLASPLRQVPELCALDRVIDQSTTPPETIRPQPHSDRTRERTLDHGNQFTQFVVLSWTRRLKSRRSCVRNLLRQWQCRRETGCCTSRHVSTTLRPIFPLSRAIFKDELGVHRPLSSARRRLKTAVQLTTTDSRTSLSRTI